jgi:hypothetical protein
MQSKLAVDGVALRVQWPAPLLDASGIMSL